MALKNSKQIMNTSKNSKKNQNIILKIILNWNKVRKEINNTSSNFEIFEFNYKLGI
jgi:Mlc titration factor MtfA (ptsG expression regulator)